MKEGARIFAKALIISISLQRASSARRNESRVEIAPATLLRSKRSHLISHHLSSLPLSPVLSPAEAISSANCGHNVWRPLNICILRFEGATKYYNIRIERAARLRFFRMYFHLQRDGYAGEEEGGRNRQNGLEVSRYIEAVNGITAFVDAMPPSTAIFIVVAFSAPPLLWYVARVVHGKREHQLRGEFTATWKLFFYIRVIPQSFDPFAISEWWEKRDWIENDQSRNLHATVLRKVRYLDKNRTTIGLLTVIAPVWSLSILHKMNKQSEATF